MNLTLEIISTTTGMPAVRQRSFREDGGRIGRDKSNDWVLPHNKVSSRHAVVTFRNGTFYIEDRSRNGVFLNSTTNRLTPGRPQALQSGDVLFIEPYEIQVTITEDMEDSALNFVRDADPYAQRPAPAMPVYAPPPSPQHIESPGAPEDYDAGSGEVDPLKLLGGSGGAPAPARPAPPRDVLRAEELERRPMAGHYQPPPIVPPPSPPTPPPVSPPGAELIPDNYDPLLDAIVPDPIPEPRRDVTPAVPEIDPFGPPPPIPEPPVTPPPPRVERAADVVAPSARTPEPPPPVDDDPFGLTPPEGLQAEVLHLPTPAPAPVQRPTPGRGATPPPPVAPPPAQTPSPPPPAEKERLDALEDKPTVWPAGNAESLGTAAPPVAGPPPPVVPPPAAVSQPVAVTPPTPPVAAAPAPAPVAHAPVSAPPPAPTPAGDLAQVLAGAGLQDINVTPELAESFGRILRIVVAGVMDLLRSRQQVKDELRMRQTMFRPLDNNPLKFSANVEDALHNLLVKRNPAYLKPVDAFADAFDDLRDHQLAMLAGLRVAFEAMLAEFDPARLEEQFDRQLKKGALLSVPAKLRYWDAYREHTKQLLQDMDATFRKWFGEEFVKAYEEQLDRLEADRREAKP